jgi:hypothetical protein
MVSAEDAVVLWNEASSCACLHTATALGLCCPFQLYHAVLAS